MPNSSKIYSSIGRNAGFYETILTLNGYKRSVRYFISHLSLPEDCEIEILDAGCGIGIFTFALLEKYPKSKIVAFDFNKELIDSLNLKLTNNGLKERVTTFVGDIKGALTEIAQKKFDLIVTAGVLEYLPLEDAAKNLTRFLADGGYFLSSPVSNNLLGKMVAWTYGCWPYTRDRNIKAFTDAGLSLEKLVTLPPYLPTSFKEMLLFRSPKIR